MSDAPGIAGDETRKLIAGAILAGQRDVPLNVNAAFESLSAILIDGTPGEVSVGFTAPASSIQGNGVVTGGMLAYMLDNAIAIAVLSALEPGKTCSTISLTVNMLSGAAAGKLYANAGVDRKGRNIAFAHGQLFDENRRLVANATSSLAIITVRQVPPA